MSTNSNCSILEVERGRWYYILEDYSAPKNAWDWREYATAYGPFASSDASIEHLHRYHANPGGYSIDALEAGVERLNFDKDPVLKKLIEEAPKRTRDLRGSGFMHFQA